MRLRDIHTRIPSFGTRRRIPVIEPEFSRSPSDPVRTVLPTGTELDMLARDLVAYVAFGYQHRTREQCWLVVYDARREQAPDLITPVRPHRLIPVANRSGTPESHCVVTYGDTRRLLSRDMTLVGYLHTHVPGNEQDQWPSHIDHCKLPRGTIGGVHLLGHNRVHWYDRSRILRSSPVFLPPSDLADGDPMDRDPMDRDDDSHDTDPEESQ